MLQGTLFCFSAHTCICVYWRGPCFVLVYTHVYLFILQGSHLVLVLTRVYLFVLQGSHLVLVLTRVYLFVLQGSHLVLVRIHGYLFFITGEPFGFSGHTQAHICICSQSGVLVVEETTHRPLVEYLVVPSLPRAATVEWQVYARTQDARFIGEIPLQCM